MTTGDWLGVISGVLIFGVMGAWLYKISKVDVPRRRNLWFAAMLTASILGLLAFFQDAGWIGGVPAGLAIVLGLLFPALRLQSSLDKNVPSVMVGDNVLNFTAPNDTGEVFDLATLKGTPFLLKFFRGHW